MMKMLSLAREALINISEKELVHYTQLAGIMKINPHYAYTICRSLSKDEYIVIIDDVGGCKITPKGRHFLNGNNTRT
jgi:Mn-dependent DtxR family transcriptional regulator